MKLSQDRANAVRDLLLAAGVSEEGLEVNASARARASPPTATATPSNGEVAIDVADGERAGGRSGRKDRCDGLNPLR